MREHKTEEWEKDPYVQKWFNKKAESTVKAYRSYFPKWLSFIKMTPTAQYEKRLKDDTSTDPLIKHYFEEKWVEFKRELQTEFDTISAVKNHLTTVRSFFSANRVPLKLSANDRKIEVDQKIVKRTWVPTNTELRVLYGMANVRDRALLLVLYQSGFSEKDVEALNIGDFEKNNKNQLYDLDKHVFIEKRREKTNIIQATCISFEAIHDIKLMLRERENPKTGPLFITPKNSRLTVRFINEAMKTLAQKAFPERDFKTRNLRDSYNSGLLEANIQPQELKDVMMGHKRKGARSHYAYNEQTITKAYEKAFRFLSINGGTQARADLSRIEQTVMGLSELVTKQQQDIKTLEEALQTTEKRTIQTLIKYLRKLGYKGALLIKDENKTEAVELDPDS